MRDNLEREADREDPIDQELLKVASSFTPARMKSPIWVRLPLAVRFWSRVDKSGECWLWTGHRNLLGYGTFQDQGKPIRAHRFSYELAFGPIPAGLFVCHHCDNPPCCNPAHLFVGTPKDNMQDMHRKGRSRGQLFGPRGETSYLAKLTASDVLEIRSLHGRMMLRELAARFGVSMGAISHIQAGRSWKHLIGASQ